jgi:hypothetical protein
MDRRLIYIVVASIIIGFIGLNIMYPSTTDYRVTNTLWNGYSRAISLVDAKVITSNFIDSLVSMDAERSLLILIPYQKLDNSEMESLASFLDSGGRLVLLDDYGYGNDLLEYLDIPVRFDNNGTLVDPLFNYKNGRIPKIIWIDTKNILFTNISEIYLNHAVKLNVMGRADILANSSSFAFFDRDGNYVWGEDEEKGMHPVIAYTKYGRGDILIISDPSIWINSMIDLGDNARLLENIAGDRTIYIDHTHLVISIHDIIQQYIIDVHRFLSAQPFISILTLTLLFIVIFRFREERSLAQ